MRINRSLLNWGVFFIALGGIPLAVDQGWLESDIASELGQLWPLILVGIGLGLILRWTPLAWFGGALVAATFGIIIGAAAVTVRDNDLGNIQSIIPAIASGACADGDTPPETTTWEGLSASEEFRLDVSIPCGQLGVTRAADPTWSVVAAHESGEAPVVQETDGANGTTGLSIRDGGDDLAFVGRQARSDWAVKVPEGAALSLVVSLDAAEGTIDTGTGPVDRLDGSFNAADASIDLGEASTEVTPSLDLTLNASDGRLVLPGGSAQLSASLNASSLDVCSPSGIPLRLELNETLSSSDLDDAGLDEVGEGVWETPGFSRSGDHQTLEISSTVSSLKIERPEACA